MASQREIKKAFEDAVKAVVANRRGDGRHSKVLRTSKRYEQLSGLSHRKAVDTIYKEAEHRLAK